MNLSNYLKEVAKEVKLSTFPTQNTVINFTLFVVLFTAAMAVFLGVLDVLLGGAILKAIETLKAGSLVANTAPQALPDVSTTTQILQNATNTLVK
jgi:preprotein translocase SecE subunit